MSTTLARCLATELVTVSQAHDKSSLLKEIAVLAKQSEILADLTAGELEAELKKRESLGTTGFGNGIAIPHCHINGIDDFVVGLIATPEGVQYESLDGAPVLVSIFIIAPKEKNQEHIRLLSKVSQALLSHGVVDEILGSTDPAQMRSSLLSRLGQGQEAITNNEMSLFHLLVQDEGILETALQVFASLDASSVMVLEGRRAGSYLSKTPLFLGMWQEEAVQFARLIVAVVDRAMANETIRRLEQRCGRLDGDEDLLLVRFDASFASGGLRL